MVSGSNHSFRAIFLSKCRLSLHLCFTLRTVCLILSQCNAFSRGFGFTFPIHIHFRCTFSGWQRPFHSTSQWINHKQKYLFLKCFVDMKVLQPFMDICSLLLYWQVKGGDSVSLHRFQPSRNHPTTILNMTKHLQWIQACLYLFIDHSGFYVLFSRAHTLWPIFALNSMGEFFSVSEMWTISLILSDCLLCCIFFIANTQNKCMLTG